MTKLTHSINSSGRLNQQGYIALLTVIIMSAILTALITSMSWQTTVFRAATMDREFKEQSRQLASACAAEAMLKFALDKSYRGPETILVAGQECTIISLVLPNQQESLITTKAQVSDLITTWQTQFNLDNMSVISQAEIIN